jgi:two-component system cell cycle sensor histidine kinase PleC
LVKTSTLNDKIIVDRRKRHRNSDVSRAVRQSRARLVQHAQNPDFDRDMLRVHARALVGGLAPTGFLIFVAMAGALYLGATPLVILWAAITVVAQVGIALYGRAILRLDTGQLDIHPTRLRFLVSHFATSICWAGFVVATTGVGSAAESSVFTGGVLLISMGAGALITYALRYALLSSFCLPILIYCAAFWWVRETQHLIMITMLVASLPFFFFIARNMHDAAHQFLSFRSEKDGLIAELETAKTHSDEARLRAEEANLAKSRFLASMSHELRTPLNAILGFSEVMSNEVLGPINNPSYKEYVGDIHDSGSHLLNLINEILDLSRIEAGKREMNEEAVLLTEVVEDCARMLDIKIRNKQIRLELEFEDGLPTVWVDEKAIRQVSLNLMSNAVKFTPSSGTITVQVGWTAAGGQYISVRDNGPGIAPEEIPVVLSAFGQGSIAIKSAEQGTGLGLPIVQALMHLHGGRFDLRSKLREGTVATALLPRARVMTHDDAMATA